ncbi:MAG: hypothetical protein Q9M16_05465 [Mariprofundus sp.]|nr:hypothetical protein [Mariprofundus sp.]
MIIAPTTTPAAVLDQSSVNQSQQQQVQSAEFSRKASVTVQFSPEARELAGTENKESSPQQRQEASQRTPAAPVTVQLSSTARELAATDNAPLAPQQKIEAQVNKQINEVVAANKQQPINPTSKQPENNKILSVS